MSLQVLELGRVDRDTDVFHLGEHPYQRDFDLVVAARACRCASSAAVIGSTSRATAQRAPRHFDRPVLGSAVEIELQLRRAVCVRADGSSRPA